jgi:uncharacterized protein (DUF342 family)
LSHDSITIQRSLIHHGDVNLATGNLEFNGPVRITGSIDTGASVSVFNGGLFVKGSIKSPHVNIKGDLEVGGGINTSSSKGTLRVSGNISARFIENSSIECGGNLHARKTITNSRINCGGDISTSEQDGRIAGGVINAAGSIHTHSLGFLTHTGTLIYAGSSWRALMGIQILTRRLKKVETALESARQSLRELTRRTPEQITKKHSDLRAQLQKDIPRMRKIGDQIKLRIVHKQTEIRHNPQSFVKIFGTIHNTCRITVAGQAIPVTSPLTNVIIRGKKVRGSFISDIDADVGKRNQNKTA